MVDLTSYSPVRLNKSNECMHGEVKQLKQLQYTAFSKYIEHTHCFMVTIKFCVRFRLKFGRLYIKIVSEYITHLMASGSKSLAGGRPLLLFLPSSSELRSTPLLRV